MLIVKCFDKKSGLSSTYALVFGFIMTPMPLSQRLIFLEYIPVKYPSNKNHEPEESPSKSNIFLSLHNGRSPLHDDKRNIGQANLYLNHVGEPELFVGAPEFFVWMSELFVWKSELFVWKSVLFVWMPELFVWALKYYILTHSVEWIKNKKNWR